MDEQGFRPHSTAARSRLRAITGMAGERVRAAAAWLGRGVRDRWWLRLVLWAALAATLTLTLAGGAAWRTCDFAGCPDAGRLAVYRPGGAPLLLDRNGKVLATLVPDNLQQVNLRSLPEYLPAAFIAIEDRRFYGHGAVDWRRVAGAFGANLRARGVEQGFSTISMQLARNLFPQEIPGKERTVSRKLSEIRVAQQIEARFTKAQILELYLNHIYFGNGAHGLEAAAWQYFRQPAARLSLSQAALLAALPKGPTRYDPRRHPQHALGRRNLVLACMAAQGIITPERAAAAAREPLGARPAPERPLAAQTLAPWFVDEVRRQLEERFGETLYNRPMRVWTSLDLGTQRAAEEELGRQLHSIEAGRLGRSSRQAAKGKRAKAGEDDGEDGKLAGAGGGSRIEGAVVTLAADSGDVLAWVGGRDYAASQFDRVVNAHRQAGSAWKPFVYAAALARGVGLRQVIADTPLVVPLGGGATWEPRNFDGRFDGRVTLRDALARSKNVPTVRLAEAVGYARIAALATDDGITEQIPLLPSMALGTVAVSPLEITAAYTTFANQGWRAAPRLVLRVERADGSLLWAAPEPKRRQVLDPAVVYLLDDALREAMIRGSGAPGLPPGFAGRVAGKTGTSTGGDDAWFVGFTPQVVTGVWIGFDEPRPIADLATGGRLAAPVFRHLMSRLYAGRTAPNWWPAPSGVESWPIDPESGLALSPGCAPLGGAGQPPTREIFLVGHEAPFTCPGTVEAGGAITLQASAVTAPAAGDPNGDDDTAESGTPDAGDNGQLGQVAQVEPARAEAGEPAAAAASADVEGWWDITLAADANGAAARGPRRTYRINLHQEGAQITGEGESWDEGGSPATAAAHTRIDLAGTLQGRDLRLRFTEQGATGGFSGTLSWRLAPRGESLSGPFSAAAGDFHGIATGVRLH
jgi:penicillin-binding protein 1A